MRICLVIPSSPFLLDQRVFVSLGVLKVAGALEQSGHSVQVMDLSGNESGFIEGYADIDVWGVTATTPQMPAAMDLLQKLRGFTGKKIILGGPHATLVHAAAKGEEKRGIVNGRARKALDHLLANFDVVVAGDGESAILKAIHADAKGLIDADDPKSDMFLTHIGFSESPWPARHLIDMDSYHYEIDGHRATSIVAQLGCPFGCNFCGGRLSPMLRKIRLRSTENVIAEMRHMHEKYGYTGFMFYDDELNVNPKLIELLKAIYKLQGELKTEFRLRGFVKAELFTAEQAQWMYIAGFRWLLCGFESGSPRILKNIQKRATREDNTAMLINARKTGLKVKALMSLGHAGESRETIADTKEWLLTYQPDDFDATVITVYPGTPYYDSAKHISEVPCCGNSNHPPPIGKENAWVFEIYGDRLYHQDLDFTKELAYYKGVPGEYTSFVWTDYLTSKELVAERDALEAEVRATLELPYPGPTTAKFEQSMGQAKV